MSRTVLDVTRLLTRAGFAVATGVDRVELAYARRALTRPPRQVGFAAIVGRRAVPLDAGRVRAFLNELDAKWRGAPGDDRAMRTLAAKLDAGAEPAAAADDPKSDQARRRGMALRAGAPLGLSRAAVRPGDIYVHVSHIRLDRPEVFARLKRDGARLTLLIHDLIPIRFPEYAKPGEGERHARRMTAAIETATTLIANSADTGRDLAAFAREIGREAPPIVVAPLGLEQGFAPDVPPLAARTPYFVTLGTIEPRKNHLLLLHVWRRLAERLGDAAPKLVIVGRRGWENEMVIDLLERSPGVKAHVIEANDLSDAALVSLIKGARALLFPSFAEGYGLPLAEALALGAPAIASDLPAFNEIAGDRVEFLAPLDGPAWERAVLDYCACPSPRREDALRRADGFTAPNWDAHFRIVAQATGLG